MAIHANSTTAPARPLLPVRGPDGRFARRAEPRHELPPEPLLAPACEAESTAPAASVARGLIPETAPESTALRPAYRTAPDTPDAVRRDLDALVAEVRFLKSEEPVHGPNLGHGASAEPASALAARRLHERRQLHQALGLGFAVLDAIGLGPAALDEIDRAIRFMDEADGDADFEPALGAPENHPGRFHIDMDDRYHVGSRWHPLGDQRAWASGQDADTDALDQGESEAGYDLGCGSEHDGCEPDEDREPSLGALDIVDQTHWAESDGSEREMDEGGGFGAHLTMEASNANAAAAREARQQVRALHGRIKGARPRRDPDEVVFLKGLPPGTALWQPAFIRDRHGHGTRVEVTA